MGGIAMSTPTAAETFIPLDDPDPATPGDPFTRLRYSYGQLLGAEDFTTEQRYSVAGTGDQPWHPATSGNTAAGMPVPWASYAFPGGTGGFVTTAGAQAGAATAPMCTGNSPTGGSKLLPVSAFTVSGTVANIDATLNKLGVSFNDPIYFEYHYSPFGAGATANVFTRACANFKTAGTQHTITQQIEVNDTTQEVEVRPAFTENEFE